MLVALDAVGIRGHGAATVLCELMHWLPLVRPTWQWRVFLLERRLREFDDPPVSPLVTLVPTSHGDSGLARLVWINQQLRTRVKSAKANLLFSLANIAPSRVVCPQVVFCQQSLALFSECQSDWPMLRRMRFWVMRRQILRGAWASQAVVVQTRSMRDRLLALEPTLAGRVHVIPSGYRTLMNCALIRPDKKTLIDSASRPRLIYVTHPSEHKNHETLVQSLSRIAKVLPGVRLLLTLERNRPPDARYANFVHSIEHAALVDQVQDRIIWLGQLNSIEVAYALGQSDMLVFPSLAESFGLGLVEAMAAGCPIAAADLPYAHDVGGDAVVYFDPCDANNVASVVTRVFSDSTTLNGLRLAGEKQKEHYNYKRIASQIAGVLEEATTLTGC